MPYTPAEGSAGLISALLTPYDNYAAKSAARQEAAQLQTVLAQQAQLDLAKEQQAAANTEAYFQKVRSLPFMGKDVAKLRTLKNEEEKALFTRLRDNYKGNFKQFWAAEGPQWQAASADRLINSETYQNGMRNVEQVHAAREAQNKGEYLAGNGDLHNYQTGEQRLQDFLMGKTDNFVHTGSYKPEDDMKYFRDNTAPGKFGWEQTPVTEEQKLNHLIDTHGDAIGKDKYLRQHKGTSLFWRTEPLTKAYDFQRDNGRYAMEQGRYAMNAESHAADMQLKRDRHKKNLAELEEASTPFGAQFFAHADELVPLYHAAGGNKKLLNSGVDLSGTDRLAGYTLYDHADQALAAQLGLRKNGDSYGRGNITEGFTTQNGVHAFQLPSGSDDFTVVDYSPKIYYSPKDYEKAKKGEAVRGYAKVKLHFKNHAAAEKSGLYDEGVFFDSDTKAGAGVYDPNTQTATVYVPTQVNRAMLKSVQKATSGQKVANEGDAPYVTAATL